MLSPEFPVNNNPTVKTPTAQTFPKADRLKFTHAFSKYDVWKDWNVWLVVLALSTLLLSRANAFLALWSLVKFLQAASFDSRACENSDEEEGEEEEEEEEGKEDSPRLSAANRSRCWGLISWQRGSTVNCCYMQLTVLYVERQKLSTALHCGKKMLLSLTVRDLER